jgi:aminomethyltransferase
MLRKSTFFDFLNRRDDLDFDEFLRVHTKDEHYIDWHHFVLPNDYGDAELEYRAIRNSCAMFDVSPIRKYRIRGGGAGAFLDHLLTRPVSPSPSMRGIYTAYCNADGSLKDDSILYKYADDDYLLMPADIDHDVYFEALRARLDIHDVSIVECSDTLAGISLQGPLSATVLHRWHFDGVEELKPFDVREYSFAGGTIRISRMGFTADLGYECWFEPRLCSAFEEGVLSAGKSLGIEIPGYGLTALEACRLEGGLIVPGWDCATEADPNPDFERSPFELGLGWLVKFDGRDFVGRDALLAQRESGARFALRSFEIEDPRKPEDGAGLYATIDGADVAIGLVACSSWSWGLGRMIGHASVESRYADCKRAYICWGEERVSAELTQGPLVRLPRRTQVPAPIAGGLN